jgi:hypothetical protein
MIKYSEVFKLVTLEIILNIANFNFNFILQINWGEGVGEAFLSSLSCVVIKKEGKNERTEMKKERKKVRRKKKEMKERKRDNKGK